MKISFISFDLSSNGLARIVDIAKILEKKYEVEIVGPMFGNQIWAPYAKIYKYKKVKGKNFPGFFKSIDKMLKMIEGNIIYASNLKMSSYGVALLKKILDKNKSIIVDISDWILGYSLNKNITYILKDALASLNLPNGLLYLLLIESFIKYSDERTVVSKFFLNKYGGTYLPQFVDTDAYDPKKFDRENLRKQWDITENKIISFIGTPRPHKGIEELIKAVNMLDNKYKIRIIMTGNEKDPYTNYILSMGGKKIIFLGQRPRYEEPMYLSMADLIVLPQRLNYVTMAQVPLKIMTAMSMSKPIIATKVSDLPEILDGCGILVNPVNINELTNSISYVFDNNSISTKLGEEARKRCVDKYSVKAVSNILYEVVDRFI